MWAPVAQGGEGGLVTRDGILCLVLAHNFHPCHKKTSSRVNLIGSIRATPVVL
jgi:hypothetical protein